MAQFGFDRNALGVRALDDAFGDRDVLLERIVLASIITDE